MLGTKTDAKRQQIQFGYDVYKRVTPAPWDHFKDRQLVAFGQPISGG